MKQDDQHHYLFQNGEFLAYRMHYNMKRVLYVLDGKFFEVIYMPDRNQIDEIRKVSVDLVIKCYADQVKLNDIIF